MMSTGKVRRVTILSIYPNLPNPGIKPKHLFEPDSNGTHYLVEREVWDRIEELETFDKRHADDECPMCETVGLSNGEYFDGVCNKCRQSHHITTEQIRAAWKAISETKPTDFLEWDVVRWIEKSIFNELGIVRCRKCSGM
jgi:hypothetical protein